MDLVVKSGKGRLLVETKRSRREISQRKRDEFIQHLSQSCNVTLSAERTGVAFSTFYKIRQRDAAFRRRKRARGARRQMLQRPEGAAVGDRI